jgi:putative hemolysin
LSTIILYLILLALFLAVSVFFSASETAFTAINRLKLSAQADGGDRKAQIIKAVVANPDRLLGVILLGNTVANISAATLATYLVAEYAPGDRAKSASVVVSLALTVVVLICCELTPKIIAATHAEQVSRRFLPLVRIVIVVLSPFARVSAWIANILVRMLGYSAAASPFAHGLSEAEIRAIITAPGTGGMASAKREMLSNVLEIADTQVRGIMISRVEVTALDIDAPIAEILSVVTKTNYSRIPVYRDNFENTLGILNVKDLLSYLDHPGDIKLQGLLRPVQYIPDTARLEPVLRLFQSMHLHMAVVVDEFGGVEGIVTLEDLLEEIVGEIRDEHDTETESVRELGPGFYSVAGHVPVKEFNRVFPKTRIPESPEYTTVVGFLQSRTGRLLQRGDIVRYKNLSFSVENVEGLRIVSLGVRVRSLKPDQAPVATGKP